MVDDGDQLLHSIGEKCICVQSIFPPWYDTGFVETYPQLKHDTVLLTRAYIT